ncbi:FadR/GntR family transcriptional regulator [Azospirillum sp. SYSU D00513]|uniref:FadR/GntR family transcriptional regulator n=1 Tax=Azospirillum sp. SYSU D00513 TaxID=2812561 RepID=UPI001A97A80F|nr:FadR/GntR family transcriptional regulator [Azospirillum sp. SYSU D00513]
MTNPVPLRPASPTLTLRPGKRERLADQLYGQILEQIVSGTLNEGDRLPTEKDLSQLFGVSRPVVREALMRLHADGLILSQQGAGTFVRRRPPRGLVQFAAPSEIAGLLRCYEARIAIECEAAALAARRRTDEQLGRLRQLFESLRASVEAGEMDDKADYGFHRTIAEASHNHIFVELLDGLFPIVQVAMRTALSITGQGSATRRSTIVEEHERIYEAIAEGDPEAARMAMHHHIDQVRRRVTDHHNQP